MKNTLTLPQWLHDCKCFAIKPCEIKIEKEEWDACYYKQEFLNQNNFPYVLEGIYCVGDLPTKYKRLKSKVCFVLEEKEWYVAGYLLKENMMASNQEFHPFGIHFILRPWESKEKIDEFETKKYERIEMILI